MSNKKDSLGDRMKSYEGISRIYLTKRMPVIIRIDGKAFHSFTKGFRRTFDEILIKAMQETAKYLCKNIMGCNLIWLRLRINTRSLMSGIKGMPAIHSEELKGYMNVR